MIEKEPEKPSGISQAPAVQLPAPEMRLESLWEGEFRHWREHDLQLLEFARKAPAGEIERLIEDFRRSLVTTPGLKPNPVGAGLGIQSLEGTMITKLLTSVERFGIAIMSGFFLASVVCFLAVAIGGWNFGTLPMVGIAIVTAFAIIYAYSTRVRTK